jgi:Ig domain of plant-specific actin-binding protein
MVRKLVVVAALFATSAVVATVAGARPLDTGIAPPKGIPDLGQMALRVPDFAAAKVARQGYVKADDPFVASYEREFKTLSVRVGRSTLLALESDVDLAETADGAHAFMGLIPLGLALLDPKDLAAEISSGGFRATYVRVSKPAKLRAGDEALEVTIRIGTKAGEFRALLVFIRVNRVIGLLIAAGPPRVRIGIPLATALSRLFSHHVHDGLVPVNTLPPTISGTPQVGQSLTASPGTWSNKPTSFAYVWQRCDQAGANCVDIAGATGQGFTPTPAEAGSTLRVVVTATNPLGSKRAVSAATPVVAGVPANTQLPGISGTAAAGQTLTATPGIWTGDPTSFAYQWQRCDQAGANCADIAGATTQTYAVDPADVSSTIRVGVTAANAAGATVAFSAPTAIVAG